MSELVGKFVCAPSIINEQAFGWPALVASATATQLTLVKLARGDWNSTEKEWEASTSTAPSEHEVPKRCKKTSIKYVCDTAEEAAALYAAAISTRKRIELFRKEQQAELVRQVETNTLPFPANK